MPDFLLIAAAAACLLALLTGPLGCLVVWQRMAYFGDTLAHSALLGVAASLLLSLPLPVGVLGVSGLLAAALVLLKRRQTLAWDTLLGILSHSMLAFGLIAASLLPPGTLHLESLLFGDLLAIQPQRLLWLAALSAAGLFWLCRLWQPLLTLTLHEELALAEGIAVHRLRLQLVALLALVVTLAVPMTGMLLMTALLVIPAASARALAHTPLQMAAGASLLGVLASLGGLALSWFADLPASASIVLVSFLLFAISLLVRR